MPVWNRCDLMAIVASVKLARARIIELCERFGVETYLKTLDLMLERNKQAMSELIRTSIPDEQLYFEVGTARRRPVLKGADNHG
jgi:N-methylhydantoinase B